MWQVTAFLSHLDKLSPQVSTAWKAAAGGSQETDSSRDESKTKMQDKKGMEMPMH
jgi:hypothetical protein